MSNPRRVEFKFDARSLRPVNQICRQIGCDCMEIKIPPNPATGSIEQLVLIPFLGFNLAYRTMLEQVGEVDRAVEEILKVAEAEQAVSATIWARTETYSPSYAEYVEACRRERDRLSRCKGIEVRPQPLQGADGE